MRQFESNIGKSGVLPGYLPDRFFRFGISSRRLPQTAVHGVLSLLNYLGCQSIELLHFGVFGQPSCQGRRSTGLQRGPYMGSLPSVTSRPLTDLWQRLWHVARPTPASFQFFHWTSSIATVQSTLSSSLPFTIIGFGKLGRRHSRDLQLDFMILSWLSGH